MPRLRRLAVRSAARWAPALAVVFCLGQWAIAQDADMPADGPPDQASESALDAEGLYEEARRCEEIGDLERAQGIYIDIVQRYPDSEWARLARERLLLWVERDTDADWPSVEPEGAGTSLARIALSVVSSLFWLLFVLSWIGFFAYRAGWFWRWTFMTRVADRVRGAVSGLASRKKLKRELEARKANPRDARARHTLGVIYYQSRLLDQALEELSESVAIDPDRTDAQYHLGLTLLKLNRPAEAVEPLEKVVTEKPRHGGDALVRLAEAKLAVGAASEAEGLAREAMKRGPTDAASRYYLAVALDAQGKGGEVPALLAEAIQLGRSYRGVRRSEALAAARNAQAYLRDRGL